MITAHQMLPLLCCLSVGGTMLPGTASADEMEAPANAFAAAAPSPSALPEVTAASIEKDIADVRAADALDAETKSLILGMYQDALAEIERTTALNQQAANFKQVLRRSPSELAKVRAELAQPPRIERSDAPIDATTTQLEVRLVEMQDRLNEAQNELTRLEGEPQRRNERRLKGIPEQIIAANRGIAELDAEASVPATEDLPEMAAARDALLAARRQALAAEIACCMIERESYNAEDELLFKHGDLASRNITMLKQSVDALQKMVHTRRRREAEARLKQAEIDLHCTYPELHRLAEENERLAKRVSQIDDDVAAATRLTVESATALSEIERAFQNMTKRVELGLAQHLGPYLLQCRAGLLRKRRKIGATRLSQSQIDAALREWLDLNESGQHLGDIDQECDDLLRTVEVRAGSPRAGLKAEARRLLESRREIVDTLITASERYIREIGPLTAADKELFDAIDRQLEYIDERIFWVRSAEPLAAGDLVAASAAFRRYARPESWRVVARQLVRGTASHPLSCLVAAVLFLGLLSAQTRIRRRLCELGLRAARATADSMLVTFRALTLTLMTAAPWPVPVALCWWLLAHTDGTSELGRALTPALGSTALLLVQLEFLRQACCAQGLGAAHFAWPERSMRLLRRQLGWFMPAVLPLTLLGTTTQALDGGRLLALNRLSFIPMMLLLSAVTYRLFRPCGGIFHEFLARRRRGWQSLYRMAFLLLASTPAALAILAAQGYLYTARQLAWRFQASLWLLAVFLISGALLLRWLTILRRRLSIRQAHLRRAAALRAHGCIDRSPVPGDGQDHADLPTFNRQTGRIVGTALALGFAAGLWWIWADALPALSLLNVPLWLVEGPGGAAHIEPVKVTNLLEAVMAVILTVVATRNIPGLLEIVFLQRLPIEMATRYAVTTLFRYAITVAGIVVACAAVGVTWSKIHWLVAAVSVGLGFGLQEIFANFVSGLIIFCERPIRLGDIVTVDDVSGTVSRIHIRATTITDFDRKELVVPNKEFITGRLLNWTLSDPVSRVCLNVGIAYGSDIERARALLLQLAAETPGVLTEPVPIASFESFGDSALNLVLRCCLPNPDLESRLAVIHALNTRIHDSFRAAGIDIAFPQLDLHVRDNVLALYQRQAA